MKLISYFLLILTLGLWACNEAPKGQAVDASEATAIETQEAGADTFQIDLENSRVAWEGTEPVGDGHRGDMRLSSGELYITDGDISGGQFVINMQSINVLDLSGDRKAKLEKHLTGEDFFDVQVYPTATFTIAELSSIEGDSTANYLIKGNLAMRDSVKSIQFPAQINDSEAGIRAMTPPFTIDRTQWGVVYHSAIVGTAADRLINDQIGLQIELLAR